MAALERTYTVPLRKEYLKVPMYRRAKKAVIALREFLVRHMKSADVRLGPKVNEAIWARGITNPPHHVKVTATKDESGVVKAELFGQKWEEKKAPEEKKGKKAEHAHAEGEEHAHEHAAEKKEAPKKAEPTAEKPAEKKEAPKKAAPKKAAKKE